MVTLLTLCAGTARAGGDDYDADKDVAGEGPSYFGFVRDTRGSAVGDAQVLLQPRSGKPVTLKTNALGLYRGHVSKAVQPDEVQVSCTKAGYKQVRINRRTPPGSKSMFVETECTLQRQ
jgi:hypothetical protein